MVTRGDYVEAIDLLSDAARSTGDPALERLLLSLRNQMFDSLDLSGPATWPPPHDHRFDECSGVPEVSADAFDLEALKAGVIGKGSLIVRGLLDDTMVEMLTEVTERAFTSYDQSKHGTKIADDELWLNPWNFDDEDDGGGHIRRWTRRASGVLAADVPRSVLRLVDVFDQTGLSGVARGFFEEPAALSVLKTTLRQVAPSEVSYGWHQDGAFLGSDVRSLNIWIALSPCGMDAPSLQVVPRRLNSLVGTGSEGSAFSWSVTADQAIEAAGTDGIQWLDFEPGDVILFDHLNLHSTAVRPEMTEKRLAIEAWLFAASHFPMDRIPLVI